MFQVYKATRGVQEVTLLRLEGLSDDQLTIFVTRVSGRAVQTSISICSRRLLQANPSKKAAAQQMRTCAQLARSTLKVFDA